MGSNILDYASIPAPVYTGYTLTGWAYDDAGASLVGATDNVTADDTIYAVWAATVYTITYNLDGGENHVDNPATYTIETTTITFGAATKDAKTFDSWHDNVGLTSAITTIDLGSTGNEEIWVKWTA